MSTRRALVLGGLLGGFLVAGVLLGRACRGAPPPRVEEAAPFSWPLPPPRPPEVPSTAAALPPVLPPPPPPRPPSSPPPPERAAAAPAPVLKGGAVVGGVRFVGTPPPRKRIRMDSDPKCAELHDGPVPADDLVVDREGNVRWAFVYVAVGVRGVYAPPRIPVVLEQKQCRFVPHVVGVQVDQELVVENGDLFLHAVHFFPQENPERAFTQLKKDKQSVRFPQREVMIRAKCDVHPWESAWVGVLDHPFFSVSDEKGRYAITGIPPGRYEVRAWHERLETGAQEVDVPEDGTVPVDFLMRLR